MKIFEPIHPGEILLEEFLRPLSISQSSLARSINVSFKTINLICNRKRPISFKTALKLAHYFGMSVDYWTNAQANYELEDEIDEDLILSKMAEEIDLPDTKCISHKDTWPH